MTVFTTIINPEDFHDPRFHSPTLVSPTVQFQLLPMRYLTTYNLQHYLFDIHRLPAETHNNSILSVAISNVSFEGYGSINLLKDQFDILWDNSKLKRLDIDFTRFSFKDRIFGRVVSLINHILKNTEYNAFLSVTLAIEKNMNLSDESMKILNLLHAEYININMINLLVPKEFKRRGKTWADMLKTILSNVEMQLRGYDAENTHFIGNIEKYIGITLDCDITNDDISSIRHSVRNTVIHGERKNITDDELMVIWNWSNNIGLGQLQIKSYLTNSKNVKKFLERNQLRLQNYNSLTLPKDALLQLANEVSGGRSLSMASVESIVTIDDYVPIPYFEVQRGLPDYETALNDKVNEFNFSENDNNTLQKLPSYTSQFYVPKNQ